MISFYKGTNNAKRCPFTSAGEWYMVPFYSSMSLSASVTLRNYNKNQVAQLLVLTFSFFFFFFEVEKILTGVDEYVDVVLSYNKYHTHQ